MVISVSIILLNNSLNVIAKNNLNLIQPYNHFKMDMDMMRFLDDEDQETLYVEGDEAFQPYVADNSTQTENI